MSAPTAGWMMVPMTANDAAAGKHLQLQKQFESLFVTLKTPRDMALFSRTTFASPPDPFLEIYFSPGSVRACSAIIATYSGAPSGAPPTDGDTSLLVGHQQAWDDLLP